MLGITPACQRTKTSGLGVPCEPCGRKRAITKLSKDLVQVTIEGIAEMDGMESAWAIVLDPLCCGIDFMNLHSEGLVSAFDEGVGGWGLVKNFCEPKDKGIQVDISECTLGGGERKHSNKKPAINDNHDHARCAFTASTNPDSGVTNELGM